MMFWKYAAGVMFSGLVLAGTQLSAAEAAKPNILLILADDLGYTDLSVQGCTDFETPNIDSIAKGGVRFKQGYVSNSVCAPSRAGLLSGRIDIGFEANLPEGEHGLKADLETMADMLKRAGYATSCIGKWHLGVREPFYPTNRGFDYFCGLRAGSRSYFYDPKGSDKPNDPHNMEINGEQIEFEGYLTDYLTDKAIEIIEAGFKQNPEQPFFQFLSYTAPHHPMHAKPEHLELYKEIENETRRSYAAMMHSLDENIGRVFRYLEASGQRDNTLIVFLSDNGGPENHNASDNGVLRDQKGSLSEGGVRVPFLMQWTEKIPAGQVREDQVISLDLTPTFAAAAGVEPVEKAFGVNLLPYLVSADKSLGERTLFWRRDHMTDLAMRSGKYKWAENLVRNETCLFDLETDIGEENNIAGQYPEVVEQMRKKYHQWEIASPPPAFKSGWKWPDEEENRRRLETENKKLEWLLQEQSD